MLVQIPLMNEKNHIYQQIRPTTESRNGHACMYGPAGMCAVTIERHREEKEHVVYVVCAGRTGR